MLNSNKFFCEGASNKKKKKKNKWVHLKIIDLHSFCIFGYKVGWMISQLSPHGPPLRKKYWGGGREMKEGVWQH